MKNALDFSKFSRLYKLSKTLRFELQPQGKTEQHLQSVLEEDMHKAENYVKVKKIIDEYHKRFIERVLAGFSFSEESNEKQNTLRDYEAAFYASERDGQKVSQADLLRKISDNLRKQVSNAFTSDAKYKKTLSGDLIKVELIESGLLPLTEEEKEQIKMFQKFTTYFKDFHKNRENMYVSEEKSTAIAYRLVNENLPKFLENIKNFRKIMQVDSLRSDFESAFERYQSKFAVASVDDVFSLPYYNNVLTQSQITLYNTLLGGESVEGNGKFKGLNELINLYNQRPANRETRLPRFKMLFKQILSDRESLSWLPEMFEDDNKMLESIRQCYANLSGLWVSDEEGRSLRSLLEQLPMFELNKIYLPVRTSDASTEAFLPTGKMLTNVSQRVYGDWALLGMAVEEAFVNKYPRKPRETAEKYEERKMKYFKDHSSFSIAYLEECVASFQGVGCKDGSLIAQYFASANDSVHQQTYFERIICAHEAVKDLLDKPYPPGKQLVQDAQNVERIKNLLDAIKDLQRFVKPLLGAGNEPERDACFYGEFTAYWETLDAIGALYDKVRNRLTCKPYSEKKIKLNFENATLLDGWDVNKECAYYGLLLRKDGLYYLLIMNGNHKNAFKSSKLPTDGACYEKMNYKLLPDPYRMLPKVFFSKSRIKEFAPSRHILDIKESKSFKKEKHFNLRDCHDLIDFFKESLSKHPDWRQYGFDFTDTEHYEDMSDFYREVEHQGYKLSFRPVSVSYVDQLVEEGKAYLFKIYNKDFSPKSKGRPNLHTLYWKMLFDERNLQDVVYKLNGKAEVFFRAKSLNGNRPTHPAGIPIANKSKQNSESVFAYDLIKDKRYTLDKYHLHVPITLNFKSEENTNVNLQVNEAIKASDDIHIIGIDRGERHLLYLSLINGKGEIVKQCSLNEIVNWHNGEEHRTNYHDLLAVREEKRAEERKAWKSIETIKELKEGYLSQAIHKIVQLVVEYNAIVVLEDLNVGFMRGRQKVEKQIYQKFEKMLIEKLNYLVDKTSDAQAPCGLLRALQLTGKFESSRAMGKQNGILFYVPAWNTSKIDPTTGFVNLLNPRYVNKEKAKQFFEKFKRISYNAEKDWFEFELDFNDFTSKGEGCQNHWTLCTYGPRIVTKRNKERNSQWESHEVNLTEEFKKLFAKSFIEPEANLKQSILEKNEAGFFKELLYLFNLLLQMRNSKIKTEVDYMISPVAGSDGCFYDSRHPQAGRVLPDNADANGAYNIARKGLWIVEKIRQTDDLRKFKFPVMRNVEWLKFARRITEANV